MNQTADTQTKIADGQPGLTSPILKLFPSLQGMGIFTLVWLGQVVSQFGSSLTSFALGIWVYEKTDSVTQFALPILSAVIPIILIGPIAGVYVDRWSRRWTMIVGDTLAGVCTVVVAWLYLTGHLELWHICLTNALRASFGAFQGLAYSTATTLLVPKENLVRASGMVQIGQAASNLAAPGLAAAFLGAIHFQGIVAIDMLTLAVALLVLFGVRFPELADAVKANIQREPFLRQLTLGWRYCKQRPGLLWLIFMMTAGNFLVGATEVLQTPLVLSFASIVTLGIVLSCANAGMVAGSLFAIIWGNAQNPMQSIFVSTFSIGLCVIATGLRPSATLLAITGFIWLFSVPVLNSSIQAIYQRKVALEVQGQVLALLRSISLMALPFSFLLAGPFADRYFEPLMNRDSIVARSIGRVIGVGSGRGIALLYICMGILMLLMTGIAYFFSNLRHLEDELPDAIPDGGLPNAIPDAEYASEAS